MQIQKDGRLKFGSGKEAKIPDGIDAKKVTFLQVYFNDIFCPVLMFISSWLGYQMKLKIMTLCWWNFLIVLFHQQVRNVTYLCSELKLGQINYMSLGIGLHKFESMKVYWHNISPQSLILVCPFGSSSHMTQPFITPNSLGTLVWPSFCCFESLRSLGTLGMTILNTRWCVTSTIIQVPLLLAAHSPSISIIGDLWPFKS